jgi:Amidohydrolase family
VKRIMLSAFCLLALLALAENHSPVLKTLALTHVTVIDGTGAPPSPDQTVVIEGDHILRLGPADRTDVPKNTRLVDAHGLYLIPGLWDMHVHIWEVKRTLPMFIANGVTGVRNTGGHLDELKTWREQTASGKLLGPRMVICGPVVDGPNPSHPDHSIVVNNAAEGRAAVDFLKKNGADFVKVYDGVPREAYFAIVDEAKKQRIPFAGHVPESIQNSEASNAGQASIEHLGLILEEVSANNDEIRKIRATPVKSPAEYPARITRQLKLAVEGYAPQKLAELAALYAKNSTWQDPTLVSTNVVAHGNDASFAKDARLAYVPSAERESWRPENNMFVKFSPPEYWVQRGAEFREKLAIVGELRRAGVPFLAGTDSGGVPYTYPGFSLHDELAFLVQAGFTPMEALQTATLNPAKFLGLTDQLGTVAPGKQANLVLLEANPLDDIHNTQKIRGVVTRGQYFDRAALDALLESAKLAAAR